MNRLKIEEGKLYAWNKKIEKYEKVKIPVFREDTFFGEDSAFRAVVAPLRKTPTFWIFDLTKQEKLTLLEYLKMQVENEL